VIGHSIALPPEIKRWVVQTFLSAGSRAILVPRLGDWKVAPTRRLESLRYGGNVKMS
jgi:hypothetical protein